MGLCGEGGGREGIGGDWSMEWRGGAERGGVVKLSFNFL